MEKWRLPGETHIGPVRLRVGEADRALAFYEEVLGLTSVGVASQGEAVALASEAGESPLVVLESSPRARRKPEGTVGLYHYAMLVPDRASLARVLLRLRDARWPLQGLSDHAVSEAIYLADPDGNGIEIYADRPRESWPRLEGELQMTTLPLDVRGLVAELGDAAAQAGGAGLPRGTVMGHIHLHVSDLGKAESFYGELLGFDVMTRRYPGALFLSAGGYHHHVAVNTWAGRGAPRPPAGAVGLLDVVVVLPDETSLAQLLERVQGAGFDPRPATVAVGGWRLEDPDGNGVTLTAQHAS